jgi:hypothetical protein
MGGAIVSALASSSADGQTGTQPPLRRILVFDVNETMLDINALAPHFTREFGSADALRD